MNCHELYQICHAQTISIVFDRLELFWWSSEDHCSPAYQPLPGTAPESHQHCRSRTLEQPNSSTSIMKPKSDWSQILAHCLLRGLPTSWTKVHWEDCAHFSQTSHPALGNFANRSLDSVLNKAATMFNMYYFDTQTVLELWACSTLFTNGGH